MIDESLTRGEQTRQAILEAAERLFLSHGYNGTSMRQIAQEAGGIAVGGIYNHFGSKEDIFRALVEHRAPYPRVVATLEALEAETGPELIRQAFLNLQQIVFENLNFFGLVMIDVQEFEGNTIRGLMVNVIPSMFQFAQRAKSLGGIREDVNLFVLIRTFAMTMFGFVLTHLVVFSNGRMSLPGLPELSDEFWEAAILDVYLNGIASLEEREP